MHRVLIVGLGRIGMGYDIDLPGSYVLTHARAFNAHPEFELAGGVDPAKDRRDLFESRYGGKASGELVDALRGSRPEVVVIASPTSRHAQDLRLVLDHSSPTAILCEKPLSLDVAEARSMVEACAAKGCRLYVNYARRSDPGAIEVRRRISDGVIRGSVKGVAWYSKGLFHAGSHFFNLVEMWLGSMTGFTPIGAGRLWDGTDPEPDVRVAFAGGTIDFLAARGEFFEHYQIDLIAENGRLLYEQGGEEISWQPAVPDPAAPEYTVLSNTAETIPSDPLRSQWHVANEIAAALAGKTANLCSGADALNTLESLTAITRRP